jgi:hypothetical protein
MDGRSRRRTTCRKPKPLTALRSKAGAAPYPAPPPPPAGLPWRQGWQVDPN